MYTSQSRSGNCTYPTSPTLPCHAYISHCASHFSSDRWTLSFQGLLRYRCATLLRLSVSHPWPSITSCMAPTTCGGGSLCVQFQRVLNTSGTLHHTYHSGRGSVPAASSRGPQHSHPRSHDFCVTKARRISIHTHPTWAWTTATAEASWGHMSVCVPLDFSADGLQGGHKQMALPC